MEQLFTDFKGAAAEWKARLEKDLKGITFDQLSVTDRNGILIHPFYTSEDQPATSAPIMSEPDWSICSKIVVTDPAGANKQALAELSNGASGLYFVIGSVVDVAGLLKDIELPYIFTYFRLKAGAIGFAQQLREYIAVQGWQSDNLDCHICYDFVGDFIKTGSWSESYEKDTSLFLSFLTGTKGLQNICIDATLFQNAGANSSYELACVLSQVNEYCNLINAQGSINAVTRINIALATDTAFFEQIAKLRALRKLLPLVFEQYGIAPAIHLQVTTSNVYRSPYDSYSNLLRDSIAGMAAVIGGCNSLYIPPFDETVKEEHDFSRRMSRNQQLIFKEESYLDKVADIAAGSYYLETLTEQLAEQSWQYFKAIEAEGGLIAAFEKGLIRETIARQASELVQEYKEGKRVLIGVNKFVNANDAPQPSTLQTQPGKGLKSLFLANEIL